MSGAKPWKISLAGDLGGVHIIDFLNSKKHKNQINYSYQQITMTSCSQLRPSCFVCKKCFNHSFLLLKEVAFVEWLVVDRENIARVKLRLQEQSICNCQLVVSDNSVDLVAPGVPSV